MGFIMELAQEMVKEEERLSKYFTKAVSYLRTGDLSGDLCLNCGSFMIIDKIASPVDSGVRFVNKLTGKKPWTVVCPECGREERYISYHKNASAYR